MARMKSTKWARCPLCLEPHEVPEKGPDVDVCRKCTDDGLVAALLDSAPVEVEPVEPAPVAACG